MRVMSRAEYGSKWWARANADSRCALSGVKLAECDEPIAMILSNHKLFPNCVVLLSELEGHKLTDSIEHLAERWADSNSLLAQANERASIFNVTFGAP